MKVWKKKKIFLIPKNLSARNVSFDGGFNKHKIKLVKENYKILLENSEINKMFDKNTINSLNFLKKFLYYFTIIFICNICYLLILYTHPLYALKTYIFSNTYNNINI